MAELKWLIPSLLVCLVSVAAAPRVVNITSDSAPGWLPSVELSASAETTAKAYLADQDAGNAEAAYAMLADIDRKDQPFGEYSDHLAAFNAKAGPVISREFVRITWTKDPQAAPLPGVYVAIDLSSRFAKIDRHCGYLVLYQSPEGGPFRMMREEANMIDNASAAGIVKSHGQDGLDRMWSALSANCPNYPGNNSTP